MRKIQLAAFLIVAHPLTVVPGVVRGGVSISEGGTVGAWEREIREVDSVCIYRRVPPGEIEQQRYLRYGS